jgi:hypothetical protein
VAHSQCSLNVGKDQGKTGEASPLAMAAPTTADTTPATAPPATSGASVTGFHPFQAPTPGSTAKTETAKKSSEAGGSGKGGRSAPGLWHSPRGREQRQDRFLLMASKSWTARGPPGGKEKQGSRGCRCSGRFTDAKLGFQTWYTAGIRLFELDLENRSLHVCRSFIMKGLRLATLTGFEPVLPP